MGITRARVTLINPLRPKDSAVEILALADTGALHLCIPDSVRLQLCLEIEEHKVVTLADGSAKSVPYVWPIEIRYLNRVGCVGAIVMSDEPLIGAIPMEDMDLVVIPKTQELAVNPASPNIAMSLAK